ncbi:eCIS core domain-containing protein [Algoriphagus sp.]|uniref:eCIS core domain-containing protein n=1 Tax=Algoriphagus sp. TaxID=1872435 RepID=UPI003F72D4A8
MPSHLDKSITTKAQPTAADTLGKQDLSGTTFQFEDNRPESTVQRKFGEIVNPPLQRVQNINNTGMPSALKSGIESLSGLSLDDVRVHYNSAVPAQLHAHAFAQGADIHLGPGQERHLPHEAWHVVQQKQGRVNPTTQMMNGTRINDDAGLEKEADIMGSKSLQSDHTVPTQLRTETNYSNHVSQGKFAEDVKINEVLHFIAQFPTELNGLTFGEKNRIYTALAKEGKEYTADEIPDAILALRENKTSVATPKVEEAPKVPKPLGNRIKGGTKPSLEKTTNSSSKPTSIGAKAPVAHSGTTNEVSPAIEKEPRAGKTPVPEARSIPGKGATEHKENPIGHSPGAHNIKASEEGYANDKAILIPKFLTINNLMRGDSRLKEEISAVGFQSGEKAEGYNEQLISFLKSIPNTRASEDISKNMKNRERGIAINPTAKRHEQIDLVWSNQKIEVSGGRTITLLNYVCTGPASGAGGNEYMIKVDEVLECVSASPSIALYQAASGMQILAMASSAGKNGAFPTFHEYDFLTPIPPEWIYYCSKDGGKTQEVSGGKWYNVLDGTPR